MQLYTRYYAKTINELPPTDILLWWDALRKVSLFRDGPLKWKYKYIESLDHPNVPHSYLPEPHNLFWRSVIVAVYSMLLPITNVNLLHSTQQQLQFPFIKILQPLQRHHFRKPFQEMPCLCLLASSETPLHHEAVMISVILLCRTINLRMLKVHNLVIPTLKYI